MLSKYANELPSAMGRGFMIRWARVANEEEDPQFILNEPTRWESENIAHYKGTFRFPETLTFKKVYPSKHPMMCTSYF